MEFLNWKDVPKTQVREGVTRRVVAGERVMLSLVEAHPGHAPNPHHHPQEQIICVLRGKIRLIVGGRTGELEEGGICVVHPDVEHFSTVLGDEPALILDVFSPIREEYH